MAKGSFNYSNVQGKMSEVNGHFQTIANNLDSASENMTTYLSSPDGALYGQSATKILGTWDENASSLKNFMGVYDNWSQMVVDIGNQFATLEENTYKVKDADASKVRTAATNNRTTSLKTDGGIAGFATANKDKTRSGVDANGVPYEVTRELINGQIVESHKYDNGLIEKFTYDPNANKGKGAFTATAWTDSSGKVLNETQFEDRYKEKYAEQIAATAATAGLAAAALNDNVEIVDGNKRVKLDNGTYVVYKPDGTIEYQDAEGNVTGSRKVSDTGTVTYCDANGNPIGKVTKDGRILSASGADITDTPLADAFRERLNGIQNIPANQSGLTAEGEVIEGAEVPSGASHNVDAPDATQAPEGSNTFSFNGRNYTVTYEEDPENPGQRVQVIKNEAGEQVVPNQDMLDALNSQSQVSSSATPSDAGAAIALGLASGQYQSTTNESNQVLVEVPNSSGGVDTYEYIVHNDGTVEAYLNSSTTTTTDTTTGGPTATTTTTSTYNYGEESGERYEVQREVVTSQGNTTTTTTTDYNEGEKDPYHTNEVVEINNGSTKEVKETDTTVDGNRTTTNYSERSIAGGNEVITVNTETVETRNPDNTREVVVTHKAGEKANTIETTTYGQHNGQEVVTGERTDNKTTGDYDEYRYGEQGRVDGVDPSDQAVEHNSRVTEGNTVTETQTTHAVDGNTTTDTTSRTVTVDGVKTQEYTEERVVGENSTTVTTTDQMANTVHRVKTSNETNAVEEVYDKTPTYEETIRYDGDNQTTVRTEGDVTTITQSGQDIPEDSPAGTASISTAYNGVSHEDAVNGNFGDVTPSTVYSDNSNRVLRKVNSVEQIDYEYQGDSKVNFDRTTTSRSDPNISLTERFTEGSDSPEIIARSGYVPSIEHAGEVVPARYDTTTGEVIIGNQYNNETRTIGTVSSENLDAMMTAHENGAAVSYPANDDDYKAVVNPSDRELTDGEIIVIPAGVSCEYDYTEGSDGKYHPILIASEDSTEVTLLTYHAGDPDKYKGLDYYTDSQGHVYFAEHLRADRSVNEYSTGFHGGDSAPVPYDESPLANSGEPRPDEFTAVMQRETNKQSSATVDSTNFAIYSLPDSDPHPSNTKETTDSFLSTLGTDLNYDEEDGWTCYGRQLEETAEGYWRFNYEYNGITYTLFIDRKTGKIYV